MPRGSRHIAVEILTGRRFEPSDRCRRALRGIGKVCRRHPAGEHYFQSGGCNRLGNIVIHPSLQTLFMVSFHGVGGHGDDRAWDGRSFSRAGVSSRIVNPSISGIWNPCRRRRYVHAGTRAMTARLPLSGAGDRVPTAFSRIFRANLTVDGIVVGQKRFGRVAGFEIPADGGGSAGRCARTRSRRS